MNNKTQKRANRSPGSKKAMPGALAVRGILIDHLKADMDCHYSAKPHPTKSAAQAKVRFDNLGWEEKVNALYPFVCSYPVLGNWRDRAEAALRAIGERPERGGSEK